MTNFSAFYASLVAQFPFQITYMILQRNTSSVQTSATLAWIRHVFGANPDVFSRTSTTECTICFPFFRKSLWGCTVIDLPTTFFCRTARQCVLFVDVGVVSRSLNKGTHSTWNSYVHWVELHVLLLCLRLKHQKKSFLCIKQTILSLKWGIGPDMPNVLLEDA